MTPLVSIIIPVFNCEQYLQKTLDCVCQQSYTNLEVILVDDGSEDGSPSICDDFCEFDSRFQSIHQTNKGVGEARNSGLRIASGEYIGFVDAGDYLHSKAIELLVNSLEEGADLAMMGISITWSLDEDIYYELSSINTTNISQEQLITNMITSTGTEIFPWAVVWNKLFKKSIIGNIRFCDLMSNEDQEFNLQVYLKIEKVVYIQNPLYYYYQSENSIVRNPNTKLERLLTQTLSRYRMLSFLSGRDKSMYKGIMLEYLYRNMLKRKSVFHNTERQEDFCSLTSFIIRKTFFEYLFNRNVPIRKKIGFITKWFNLKTATSECRQ